MEQHARSPEPKIIIVAFGLLKSREEVPDLGPNMPSLWTCYTNHIQTDLSQDLPTACLFGGFWKPLLEWTCWGSRPGCADRQVLYGSGPVLSGFARCVWLLWSGAGRALDRKGWPNGQTLEATPLSIPFNTHVLKSRRLGTRISCFMKASITTFETFVGGTSQRTSEFLVLLSPFSSRFSGWEAPCVWWHVHTVHPCIPFSALPSADPSTSGTPGPPPHVQPEPLGASPRLVGKVALQAGAIRRERPPEEQLRQPEGSDQRWLGCENEESSLAPINQLSNMACNKVGPQSSGRGPM